MSKACGRDQYDQNDHIDWNIDGRRHLHHAGIREGSRWRKKASASSFLSIDSGRTGSKMLISPRWHWPGREMRGRKRIRHGTPIDGLYLALGGRKVNLRGTSLVPEGEDRGRNLKRILIGSTILSVFTAVAFSGMSTGQGGGMMKGGWWWGMDSIWLFMAISVILVVYGVFSIMKGE